MASSAIPQASWALHRFALLTAGVAVALIAVGATVTSTGSGDAVPDWPLSYGSLWPRMAGGVLIEHGHRLVAGFTALLIAALTFWLQGSPLPRGLKRLGWLALGAVLLQALLGGLRVLVISHPQVQEAALSLTRASHPEPLRLAFAVAHATLAQVVVCLTFTLAWLTAPSGARRAFSTAPPFLRRGMVALAGALFVQLLVGAVMRHMGAGRVIPDFPLSFGRLVPPFGALPYDPTAPFAPSYGEFQMQVAVHFAHRVLGILIGLATAFLWWRSLPLRPAPWDRWMDALLALVVAQIGLGALVVWTRLAVPLTIAHVAMGATLLGTSVVGSLTAWRQPSNG